MVTARPGGLPLNGRDAPVPKVKPPSPLVPTFAHVGRRRRGGHARPIIGPRGPHCLLIVQLVPGWPARVWTGLSRGRTARPPRRSSHGRSASRSGRSPSSVAPLDAGVLFTAPGCRRGRRPGGSAKSCRSGDGRVSGRGRRRRTAVAVGKRGRGHRPSPPGIGGGMCGRGDWTQHGKPCRWRGTRQRTAREGQVGPVRVAERSVGTEEAG